MKITCPNKCFDDPRSEPGFDADASANGTIDVKIGQDGKLLCVNEDGYNSVEVGPVDLSSVRCGCCGEPANLEVNLQ